MSARVVHKYSLPVADRAKVLLPFSAQILHIGEQRVGELFVWALVDPNDELSVEREFRVFGTGHPVPDAHTLSYVKTVVTQFGLVWHIFEEVPF